jgi:thiol-disulfide isomerase/thioredoxin
MLTSLIAYIAIAQTPAQALPVQPLRFSKVKDVAGASHSIPAPKAKATVVIFVTVDCPISNRLAPEVARICEEYSPKGVVFYLAYVDPRTPKADVATHLKDYSYPCPGIIDAKHDLVKAFGATVTPEAGVLDAQGIVVYRGRINDLYEEHGKPKQKAKNQDLRDALDAVIAGKPVPNPIVGAVGCYIPPLK